MKNFKVVPCSQVSGDIRVASDKSISHRALLLSALCDGDTDIINPLLSDDVYATINAVRACGASVEENGTALRVRGGIPQAPEHTIDCGNSGTLMRLFCGIAAGWDIPCKLIGDESLMQRPMKRVTDPLQQMGALISAEKDQPPVVVSKRLEPLRGILHSNTLSSAQVKSALLFAGLHAEENTVIAETVPSRDHTERMLQSFGARLRRSSDRRIVEISRGELHSPGSITIPADISSAVFFIVAAAISPGSEMVLSEVGINPTRTGALDILLQMGADLDIVNRRELGNEPVADIRVRGGDLHGIEITADMVPAAIDDIPVLMIAAATARGETRLSGANELRHKESDRITAVVAGLKALGVTCNELTDGMVVQGKNGGKPVFSGGEIDSEGDHRIAMAFTIASLRAKGEITIRDCANIATSFPNFVKLGNACGIRVIEEETE